MLISASSSASSISRSTAAPPVPVPSSRRWPIVSANADDPLRRSKTTHLGEHDGLLAIDVCPGASGGKRVMARQGRGSSRDRQAAGLGCSRTWYAGTCATRRVAPTGHRRHACRSWTSSAVPERSGGAGAAPLDSDDRAAAGVSRARRCRATPRTPTCSSTWWPSGRRRAPWC